MRTLFSLLVLCVALAACGGNSSSGSKSSSSQASVAAGNNSLLPEPELEPSAAQLYEQSLNAALELELTTESPPFA